MIPQIRDARNFAAGAVLVLIGGFFLWATWELPLGRGVRLGPGFMPFFLSFAIIGFGIVTAVQSLSAPSEPPVRIRVNVRAVLFVLLSLLVFGFLLERFGLVVAVPAMLAVAFLADREARPLEAGLFIVALTFAAIALFSWALGLNIKVLP